MKRGKTREYRRLSHGNLKKNFSVLGLGMGNIQHIPAEKIEAIVRKPQCSEFINVRVRKENAEIGK